MKLTNKFVLRTKKLPASVIPRL